MLGLGSEVRDGDGDVVAANGAFVVVVSDTVTLLFKVIGDVVVDVGCWLDDTVDEDDGVSPLGFSTTA